MYSNVYDAISLFKNKWEQKHNTWYNARRAEIQKTSFPKESVENADLYKPILNKIMTTHE